MLTRLPNNHHHWGHQHDLLESARCQSGQVKLRINWSLSVYLLGRQLQRSVAVHRMLFNRRRWRRSAHFYTAGSEHCTRRRDGRADSVVFLGPYTEITGRHWLQSINGFNVVALSASSSGTSCFYFQLSKPSRAIINSLIWQS